MMNDTTQTTPPSSKHPALSGLRSIYRAAKSGWKYVATMLNQAA